ncbi:MAG: hypothetical protein ACYDBJ_28865 [Aggregatilineales bacterium]
MIEQVMSAVYAGDEDNRHHWSQESQTYATAATLLHYLRRNWQLDPLAAVESFYHYGGRHVDVYYFTLTRAGRQVEMPVLANPPVFRVITQRGLQVERVSGKLA